MEEKPVLFVDYLQILEPTNHAMAKISEKSKNLAERTKKLTAERNKPVRKMEAVILKHRNGKIGGKTYQNAYHQIKFFARHRLSDFFLQRCTIDNVEVKY